MQSLAAIRREIDEVDARLKPLLVRRLELADAVAAAKKAEGIPLDDPRREAAILERIVAGVGDSFVSALRQVYGTLFEVSKARQTVAGV